MNQHTIAPRNEVCSTLLVIVLCKYNALYNPLILPALQNLHPNFNNLFQVL